MPPKYCVLDDATIDMIAERTARRLIELQQLIAPAPVLTQKDAMRFVQVRSQSAFDRWLTRFAPNARCGHGRYTSAALALGRRKEALGFVPRRIRRLSANEPGK